MRILKPGVSGLDIAADSLNGELWKPIKGFEGKYQVSNYSRVRSLKSIPYKNTKTKKIRNIIKPTLRIDDKGNPIQTVLVLTLSKSNKSKTLCLGRVVYEAFNGILSKDMVIVRKDNNVRNNKLNNLTIKKNDFSNLSNNTKAVEQLTKEGVFIKDFNSLKEAALETGIDSRSISAVCSTEAGNDVVKKRYTAGGYKWRYKQETTTNE